MWYEKWYGKNSDYSASFPPCLGPRSRPILPKFIVLASKNASFTTRPPVHEPKFITQASILLKATHRTPNTRQTYLYPPENTEENPASAHSSPTAPKVVYTRKVVCIPLLITAGQHSDYAPGSHTGKTSALYPGVRYENSRWCENRVE